MSNAQLGRRTFVISQAAHVVATELLAKGLIERGEHPTNRRVRLMRLSDSGWKALAECTVEIRELEGRLRAALTPTEGEALTHTLARSAEILAGGYFGDAEAEAEAVSRRKTSPSKQSRP